MPSEAWQIKPKLVGGALPIKVEIEPQNLKLVVNPVSTEMTSAALGAIGSVGDLRCCKRDSYLAVLTTVEFVKRHFDVEMEALDIRCSRYDRNK